MKRNARILFIEDEISILNEFSQVLEQKRGYEVLKTSYPEECLEFIRNHETIDMMVTDLQLPIDNCRAIGFQESAGGKETGLVLAKEFRRKFRRAPIVFWSGSFNQHIRSRLLEIGNSRLIPKRCGAEPVFEVIDDLLEGIPAGKRPRTFIVHGHDSETVTALKDYLTKDLEFPEPVVLKETASIGRTIIEKLESYADLVDIAFVLLTPDDQVVNPQGPDETLFRARQNVIFEMGFFMGMLGRVTGRVILLYRQPIELPSDISGMICIDITDGLEKADAEIREEIREWLVSAPNP